MKNPLTRDNIRAIEEMRLKAFNDKFMAFVKNATPIKSFEELEDVREKMAMITNEAFDILQLAEELKKLNLDA